MDNKAELLESFSNSKLMDIVKNHKQYGYDDSLRGVVLEILGRRGWSEEDLRLTGNLENYRYNRAEEILLSYSRSSVRVFLFYFFTKLIGLFDSFMIAPSIFYLIYNLICGLLFLAYMLFLAKCLSDHWDFYKTINKDPGGGDMIAYAFPGMPFYIFMYSFYKGQMREEMKSI